MRFSSIIILGVQVSSIAALPAHSVRRSQLNVVSQPILPRNIGAASVAALQEQVKEAQKEEAAEPAKIEVGGAEPVKEVAAPVKEVAAPAKVEAGKVANETAVVAEPKAGEEAAAGGEAAAGEEEKLAGGKQF